MSFDPYNSDLFNGVLARQYLVFNQGKLVGPMSREDWKKILTADDPIYQTAFIYEPNSKEKFKWWRADGTPRDENDVPNEYRVMVMLMGG